MIKSRKKILKTKKLTSNNISSYNYTFILSMRDDGIEYNTNFLRQFLLDYNLTETKDSQKKTTYLHIQHLANGKYETKYYNTPAYLMNIMSKEKSVITNKFNLYMNFYKQYPAECLKYMAKTWNVNNFNSKKLNGRNVFIMRPVGIGAFSGHDIAVITTNKEFDKIKRKISKRYPIIIISEYITKPMLWEGKKFHIRSYLLAKNINNIYTTYFYDFYEIFTADKLYKYGDWENMDIHDTHLKSVGKYIMGPCDFNSNMKNIFTDKIYPQMQKCMIFVSKLLKGYAKPYPNAKNAFEVFGCDFMATDDYKVKLLEINEHTGLSMEDFPDRKDEFSMKYFSKINDFVLKPIFNTKSLYSLQ